MSIGYPNFAKMLNEVLKSDALIKCNVAGKGWITFKPAQCEVVMPPNGGSWGHCFIIRNGNTSTMYQVSSVYQMEIINDTP